MKHIIKTISTPVLSLFLLGLFSCNTDSSHTRTETTVLDTDTVGAEVTYDVNRKTVESVDTVGATTEYEVEKKVVERTVEVDTITKEITKEKERNLEQGDYEVVQEEVEQDSKTEDVDIDS